MHKIIMSLKCFHNHGMFFFIFYFILWKNELIYIFHLLLFPELSHNFNIWNLFGVLKKCEFKFFLVTNFFEGSCCQYFSKRFRLLMFKLRHRLQIFYWMQNCQSWLFKIPTLCIKLYRFSLENFIKLERRIFKNYLS